MTDEIKVNVKNTADIPLFKEYSRNEILDLDESKDIDLMIIDIETRFEKNNDHNQTKATRFGMMDENEQDLAYISKTIFQMKKNPQLMRSLFIPDKEDVFFNTHSMLSYWVS